MASYKNTLKSIFLTVFRIKKTISISQLLKCKSGAGAIEFVLVIPIFLILYVGALELSVAMTISKKVVKATAVTSDIIAQSTNINKNKLKEMVGVAKSIIAPYDSDSLSLKIVGININGRGRARVAWSWDDKNRRPHAVNSRITVPKTFAIPNTFLMKTTIDLDHNLLMMAPDGSKAGVGFLNRAINMQKIYYLHQREAQVIVCKDC